jgi:hypothetical protein
MAHMATAAVQVRTAVLNILRTQEYRPIDLIKALGDQGYADSDIKQALSQLLSEGLIQLTAQRILKTTQTQDAA